MSYQFPETPILLYPSLAKELGVEAAVLLTLYHQQFQRLQNHASELIFSHQQWLALGSFWDEEQLAQLTSQLVAAGYLEASFAPDGRVQIQFVEAEADAEDAFVEEPEIEIVSRLPVVEEIHLENTAPTPVNQPSPDYSHAAYPEMQDTPYYPDHNQPAVPQSSIPTMQTNAVDRGPAPTFGGSIGWARKAQQQRSGRSDELHACFDQQEKLRKKLHPMELGWQPSANFYALLPRHNISPQFAQTCLDEFVLYWLDKDRKETNWDQKFLGWVKREWVKKQTQEGRQQRLSNEQQAGFNHENPRRDTREKRQRVTAAIMDIKDTDW